MQTLDIPQPDGSVKSFVVIERPDGSIQTIEAVLTNPEYLALELEEIE